MLTASVGGTPITPAVSKIYFHDEPMAQLPFFVVKNEFTGIWDLNNKVAEFKDYMDPSGLMPYPYPSLLEIIIDVDFSYNKDKVFRYYVNWIDEEHNYKKYSLGHETLPNTFRTFLPYGRGYFQVYLEDELKGRWQLEQFVLSKYASVTPLGVDHSMQQQRNTRLEVIRNLPSVSDLINNMNRLDNYREKLHHIILVTSSWMDKEQVDGIVDWYYGHIVAFRTDNVVWKANEDE
jgi:hypothetical protein